MEIQIFTALEDNYIYLFTDEQGNAALVDPAESRDVLHHLGQHNLNLKLILVTHGHADHTAGIEDLKRRTQCQVAGPWPNRLPMQDIEVKDGDILDFSCPIETLSTPGHTPDSVCYYMHPSSRQPGILFTGDTLFVSGCGRLGGTAQTLWQSLRKLSALPPDMLVYCGHNYTGFL